MARQIDVRRLLIEHYGLDEDTADAAYREFVTDYPMTVRESPAEEIAASIYFEEVGQ